MEVVRKVAEKVIKIPDGVKSATVYTFAAVFSKGLAIITVPIFTRLMPADDIGTVNLYNSWCTLLSIFATLSLTSGGYAVALKQYSSQRDKYVSSVLGLTSLMSIILFIFYEINPDFWNRITGLSSNLMLLMILGFLLSPAMDFWILRQRYEYKYKLPVLVTILGVTIASLASIIVILWFKDKGITNLAEGRLISNYLILYGIDLIIWIYILVKGSTLINTEFWRFSLSLSLPLIVYSVAAQILSVSDRIMIGNMVGKREVGIYGTIYSISSISLIVWSAINSSFVPYLYRNIDNVASKTKEISYKLLLVFALVLIIFTYFAPEVVRIIATEEYSEAIYIIPPISAGVFFTSVSNMYSNISIYYKKSKYVMYGAIVAALLNLVLNYISIPKFGYMVAAYTTLVCYTVFALIEGLWALKIMKQNQKNGLVYADGKILWLCIFTLVLIVPSFFLYDFTIGRYLFVIFIMLIAGLFMRLYKIIEY